MSSMSTVYFAGNRQQLKVKWYALPEVLSGTVVALAVAHSCRVGVLTATARAWLQTHLVCVPVCPRQTGSSLIHSTHPQPVAQHSWHNTQHCPNHYMWSLIQYGPERYPAVTARCVGIVRCCVNLNAKLQLLEVAHAGLYTQLLMFSQHIHK